MLQPMSVLHDLLDCERSQTAFQAQRHRPLTDGRKKNDSAPFGRKPLRPGVASICARKRRDLSALL